MIKKPTLYLLYGFIASGKTTFAKKLEKELRAVRLTHDEWMHKLYGSNPPEEKFQEYFKRVEDLIWMLTERLLKVGQDVVMDLGFWSRKQRDEARGKAEKFGANHKLYHIHCPEDIALKRCLTRTENLTEDCLYINEEAFYKLKKRFEDLGKDEGCVLVENCGK